MLVTVLPLVGDQLWLPDRSERIYYGLRKGWQRTGGAETAAITWQWGHALGSRTVKSLRDTSGVAMPLGACCKQPSNLEPKTTWPQKRK